jgi:tetratricopeptide (TPR) repeat protein
MSRQARRQQARAARRAIKAGGRLARAGMARLLQDGLERQQAGDRRAAAQAYRRILAADPHHVDALHLLAIITLHEGEADAAAELVARALDGNPDFLAARNTEGTIHLARGKPVEAEASFRRILAAQSDHREALANLGNALREQDRREEALGYYRQALELAPGMAGIHENLGTALFDLGRLDEAEAAYRRALVLEPVRAIALAGLGEILQETGRDDAAGAVFDDAVARLPEVPQLRYSRAVHRLLHGRYEAGWPDYEFRWSIRHLPVRRRSVTCPIWQGEDLAGRSIAVWSEQGPGDDVMFAQCLADLAATGARIALLAGPRLVGLLARSFPDIEIIRDDGQGLEGRWKVAADFGLPIGSLPLHLRNAEADFAGPARYLATDPARVGAWRARFAAGGPGPCVGFSWGGGANAVEQRRRTTHLDEWLEVLRVGDARFVNLQFGDYDAEIAALAADSGIEIVAGPDAGGDLDDFAAAIDALDLVITMANTTAHVAGALGRPVWTLTPATPSWRWQLGRDDSPWYPTMRLYRQGRGEGWAPVIERIAADLRDRAG